MSLEAQFPTRPADIYFSINKWPHKPDIKISVWQEKDHFVCGLKLKDNRSIVCALTGFYDKKDEELIRQTIYNGLLEEYAIDEKDIKRN